MQCQCGLRRGDFHNTAVLPVPLRSFGAERGSERLANHRKLKPAGLSGCFPLRHPILGSHPDPIGSRSGELHLRRRILDWLTKAMRHQVGRTHCLDELGINDPAAVVIESFCLDQQMGSGSGAVQERAPAAIAANRADSFMGEKRRVTNHKSTHQRSAIVGEIYFWTGLPASVQPLKPAGM